MWWKLALAALAGLFVSRTAEGATLDDTKDPNAIPPGTRGDYAGVEEQARKLARQLGWSDTAEDWFANFAKVQSYSESRGNSSAANRTASEARASVRAYERNAPKMPEITAGTTESDWTWGSGGWFGLMPANGLYAFKDQGAELGELGPNDVFDPWRSTVMMGRYVTALTGWNNFRNLPTEHQNAYALKRGFASPTLMDNVSGHQRGDIANKHVDDAVRKLGIPSSWKTQRVPKEIRTRRSDWLRVLRAGEGRNA